MEASDGAGQVGTIAPRIPRYRVLAASLQEDIRVGRYAVGSHLPPEVALCQMHAVSRHTMRDAMRLLREAKLVERRRGSGTTVLAQAPRPVFVQPLGGIDEILQFATDAKLSVRGVEIRPLAPTERERMGIESDADWGVVEATRMSASLPMALTWIYVAADFLDVLDKLHGWDGAVQQLIGRDHGVEVQRIEQACTAETLDADSADMLNVALGAAVLQTLRRYYDASERLILASRSLACPRFVYAMAYRRGV